MLTKIRDAADSQFFRLLLLVIVLSFVIWGVGDVLRGAHGRDLVELKHTDNITIDDFVKERQRLLEFLQSSTDSADYSQLAAEAESIAVQNLVKQRMMRYLASYYEINFSDKVALDYAQKKDQFNAAILKQYLRRNGISESEFIAGIKDNMAAYIIDSSFTKSYHSSLFVKAVKNYYAENSKVTIASINAEDIKNPVPPTEEQLQSFYTEHQELFKTDELRDLTLAEIDNEAIRKLVKINDEEFVDYKKAMSQETTEQLSDTDLRKNFIDLKTNDGLMAIVASLEEEIAAGTSIAELSEKFPLKVRKLNNVSLANLAEHTTAFYPNDIFALTEGEIEYPAPTTATDAASEVPVYHIIAVDKVTPATIPSFDDVHALVSKQYDINANKQKLLEIAANLSNLPENRESFLKRAGANGFKLNNITLAKNNESKETESLSPEFKNKILAARKNNAIMNVENNLIQVAYVDDIKVDEKLLNQLSDSGVMHHLDSSNMQELMAYAISLNEPEINVSLMQAVSSSTERN